MLDIPGLRRLPLSSLQDGDTLLQLPDGTLYGKVIARFGELDAACKGVPLIQHVGVKTTQHGVPHMLEAVWQIAENPLTAGVGSSYIVVRPRCDRETVGKAIAWGRKKTGLWYGFRNIFRIGWNLLVPLFKVKEPEDHNAMICSQFAAEMFHQAGFPIFGDGSHDNDVVPWDWLTEDAVEQVEIVGLMVL